MFEKEIKFIYDFSLNQIKNLGSYFTFEELSGVNLHPAILKYISAEIDYLVFEDRQKLLNDSNFDYSGEEMNKYFQMINQEIKKSKKFSLEYIDSLTLHAISFNANYLARPKWALSRLVFSKDSVMNTSEVKLILNYTYYYRYIGQIIEKYINKKRILTIDKEEFESIVDKMDKEILAGGPAQITDSAMGSMGEFFNIGSVHKSRIPLLSIELFLKEKQIDQYLERLGNALPEEPRQIYDISELQKIFTSPVPARRGSYLDRLLKQDKPASMFSEEAGSADEKAAFKEPGKDIPQDEIKPAEKQADSNDSLQNPEDVKPEAENPEEKEAGQEDQIENKDFIEKKELGVIIEDVPEASSLSSEDEVKDPILDILEEPAPEEERKEDTNSEEEDFNSTLDEETLLDFSDEAYNPEINNSALNQMDADEEVKESQTLDNPFEDADDDLFGEVIRTESGEFIFPDKEAENKDNTEDPFSFFPEESSFKQEDEDIFAPDKEPHEELETGEGVSEDDFMVVDDHEVAMGKPLESGEITETPSEEEIEAIKEENIKAGVPEIPKEAGLREEESQKPAENKPAEKKQEEKRPEDKKAPVKPAAKQVQEVKAKEKKQRQKDIAAFFSTKEIQRIISGVFNEEAEEFANALDALSEAQDEEQANQILEKILRINRLSHSSKEASIMKRVISEYFNQS